MFAIDCYSKEDYKKINKALRGQEVEYSNSEEKERLDKQTDIIFDTLKKKTLPEDMTLYRGVKNPVFILGEGYADKDIEQLRDEVIGSVFCDDAFCSTSINRMTALTSFADSWDGTIMEISAPQGANGICLKELSSNKKEDEILLQKGSYFRVDDINYDDTCKYAVKVTLIGRNAYE